MNTIERPDLGNDKDYSHHHDPIYCAVEINLAHEKITKIGHISAILDAHFPRVRDVYRVIGEIEVECAKSESALAKHILALLAEVRP